MPREKLKQIAKGFAKSYNSEPKWYYRAYRWRNLSSLRYSTIKTLLQDKAGIDISEQSLYYWLKNKTQVPKEDLGE